VRKKIDGKKIQKLKGARKNFKIIKIKKNMFA
jgi:hypothetical protein